MRIWDVAGRGMAGAACASGNINHDDDDTTMGEETSARRPRNCAEGNITPHDGIASVLEGRHRSNPSTLASD